MAPSPSEDARRRDKLPCNFPLSAPRCHDSRDDDFITSKFPTSVSDPFRFSDGLIGRSPGARRALPSTALIFRLVRNIPRKELDSHFTKGLDYRTVACGLRCRDVWQPPTSPPSRRAWSFSYCLLAQRLCFFPARLLSLFLSFGTNTANCLATACSRSLEGRRAEGAWEGKNAWTTRYDGYPRFLCYFSLFPVSFVFVSCPYFASSTEAAF
jgi:hypothetical protein